MIRSARCVAILLMLSLAPAATAEDIKLSPCPNDLSPRLCLTLLARAAAQAVSEEWRPQALADLADLVDMQRADHRDDLARETLKIASAAAAAIAHQGNRARSLGNLAARRFALGEMQSAEADAQIFSEPHVRATYLTLVLEAALAAGNEQAVERLVVAVRQAADEPANRPGSKPQPVTTVRQAYRDLILLLIKYGRHELADAIELSLAGRYTSEWVRAMKLSRRFEEALRGGLDREAEEFVQREVPSNQQQHYWKAIAEARIDKKDHAGAIAVIERHIKSPDREALLARSYLAKGEIGEAVKLAQRGSKDLWYEWGGIWTDIAIAQAKADLIEAAIASSSHTIYSTAEVKAAITAALVRADRRREALDMAGSAFDPRDTNENGHWNGEESAADAFLAVGDFKTAVSLARKYCLLRVPLRMLERKKEEGRPEEALAILDATDTIFLPCLEDTVDDARTLGRFMCHYADLKPTSAALAKAAEVSARLDYWREAEEPWFYSCLTRARAKSGDPMGARRIALGAPTAAAVRDALVSLTEFEAAREPSRAVQLYHSLLARDGRDARNGYAEAALRGLMGHLKCQYGGPCARN